MQHLHLLDILHVLKNFLDNDQLILDRLLVVPLLADVDQKQKGVDLEFVWHLVVLVLRCVVKIRKAFELLLAPVLENLDSATLLVRLLLELVGIEHFEAGIVDENGLLEERKAEFCLFVGFHCCGAPPERVMVVDQAGCEIDAGDDRALVHLRILILVWVHEARAKGGLAYSYEIAVATQLIGVGGDWTGTSDYGDFVTEYKPAEIKRS